MAVLRPLGTEVVVAIAEVPSDPSDWTALTGSELIIVGRCVGLGGVHASDYSTNQSSGRQAIRRIAPGVWSMYAIDGAASAGLDAG
jgi:hypothetical protein